MGGEVSPTFATALVPGFRFHPTDEELVGYYLKRKVCRKGFRLDAIAEIDIYKFEPWDLPSKSRLKTRDLQWYFFSVPDKKYGNGSKTSRSTEQGYWKTTGKDRSVRLSNRTIGVKKTLVYHIGRALRGERTNWVMHEYRLVDENLVKAGVFQDAFVLCRIFQKSGTGPRNGEQYGAPFVEEDWDEEILVRERGDNGNAFFCINDDGYIQESDLDKHLDLAIPSGNVLPLKLNCEDAISHKEDSKIGDNKKLSFGQGEKDDLVELSEDQDFFNLPEPYWLGPGEVKDDYFVTLNDLVGSGNANYHVDDPVNELNCLDAAFDSQVDDGFLECDDLAKPFEADESGLEMFEEYLSCLEVVNEKSQYVTSDSSKLVELEDPVLIQSPLSQEQVNRGKSQEFLTSPQQLESLGEGASLSKQNKALPKPGQDVQHSEKSDNTLLNWASHMLHCIPSRPSLASEIPTKKASIGRSSATHSTSSIHVTTGMMQLGGIRVRSYGNNWSLRKNEDVNIMLSYGMKNGDVMAADHLIANSFGSRSVIRSIWGKAGSIMVRSGFYLIFLVLISVSFKVGTYLYTG